MPKRIATTTARKSPAKKVVGPTQRPTTDENPVPASPVVDLAQIAGVIPAENLQQLATAIQSGRWLLAVWHIADGQIRLERTAVNYPTVDLPKSVTLLDDDLKQLTS